MNFNEFAAKHELTDARLCGEGIFLSAAEYWKFANRVSHLFVREQKEDPGRVFWPNLTVSRFILTKRSPALG